MILFFFKYIVKEILRKILISFFFRNSAAKKSLLAKLLIKSCEVVEIPGTTVIPEGIIYMTV